MENKIRHVGLPAYAPPKTVDLTKMIFNTEAHPPPENLEINRLNQAGLNCKSAASQAGCSILQIHLSLGRSLA
jgi:hypothetical protein